MGKWFLDFVPFSFEDVNVVWVELRGILAGTRFGRRAMNENEISRQIINAAIEVHRTLGGPGLLESVYEEALAWELSQTGLMVQRQEQLPIRYKGQLLATPLRIDLIVQGLVIVECKSISKYTEVFEAQALTYLRLSNLKLAFVINFGERVVKDGIHRVVNGL